MNDTLTQEIKQAKADMVREVVGSPEWCLAKGFLLGVAARFAMINAKRGKRNESDF